ncbi:MAG: TPM domain-containing protein [bacterium]|nr:TPM domain-containing protein [bacterium]
MTLPPLTQLVTDYSNVFDTNTLSGLNEKALTLEKQTSAQVAAVLFPHRQGNELFDIGMRLFRESGIGQEGKNNGILLLIATDEKKLRIIVGYGLEGTVPDIAASNLIENTLRPLVDE